MLSMVSDPAYSAVHDRFLPALPPALRSDWAASMYRLLRDQGELLMLVFPIGTYEGGPPYAMSVEKFGVNFLLCKLELTSLRLHGRVDALLKPHGFKKIHEETPEDSIRPRRGAERLVRWICHKQ